MLWGEGFTGRREGRGRGKAESGTVSILQAWDNQGLKDGIAYRKGRREWIREWSMGSEITANLPILKNTQLLQDSFSFGSVLQMRAVGCQNITELVSRVNKSISFQAKLRQVRLSQFSSPPGKERQAPSSHGSSTLKKSFKKSYLNASSCLLSS